MVTVPKSEGKKPKSCRVDPISMQNRTEWMQKGAISEQAITGSKSLPFLPQKLQKNYTKIAMIFHDLLTESHEKREKTPQISHLRGFVVVHKVVRK